MNEQLDHVDINPRKLGHGLWLDQPPVGDVHPGQFKTTRNCARSLFSLLQLSCAPELVTARSNARKADLEASPLDSHNETNQRSPRPCQSRNTTE